MKLVERIHSQVTTENLFSAGNHVIHTGRTRGTVVANGAAFNVPEVHVWEVRDRKVVAFRAYIDTPPCSRPWVAEGAPPVGLDTC